MATANVTNCTEEILDTEAGLGLYWRYEKAVRRAESRCGSTVVYTGAVSAVRRRLFTPLPEETLVDDLVTPLRVIQKGYRVVFEPQARALDWLSPLPGHEFTRKVRTLAGLAQTVTHMRQFVGPLSLRTWWQFLSHKGLRLLIPYALIAALGTSAMIRAPFYQAAFVLQLLFYGFGTLGFVCPRQGTLRRIVSPPHTFLLLNIAALTGTLRYLGGERLALWRPAEAYHTGN
jgi:biofilm PGA synthesis N-glycosyltransferase PgaC